MFSCETERANNILQPRRKKQAQAQARFKQVCVQVLPSHCKPARGPVMFPVQKYARTQTHNYTRNTQTTHAAFGAEGRPSRLDPRTPGKHASVRSCVCVRACVQACIRCLWCYTHSPSDGRRHLPADFEQQNKTTINKTYINKYIE